MGFRHQGAEALGIFPLSLDYQFIRVVGPTGRTSIVLRRERLGFFLFN